jgi:hypothetical protein
MRHRLGSHVLTLAQLVLLTVLVFRGAVADQHSCSSLFANAQVVTLASGHYEHLAVAPCTRASMHALQDPAYCIAYLLYPKPPEALQLVQGQGAAPACNTPSCHSLQQLLVTSSHWFCELCRHSAVEQAPLHKKPTWQHAEPQPSTR